MQELSWTRVLCWILLMAAVAVGARNFEPGLGVDGPVYASIARNMVRTHDWINLWAPVPEFKPFYEHPHLGFWQLAAVFSVLPQQDWAARIPGHIGFVLFLFLLFVWIRDLSSQREAIFAVLLLVAWPHFTNFFSAGYLDPVELLLGTLCVFLLDWFIRNDGRLALVLAAGACLTLAFLQKGMTVLGFGPAIALAFGHLIYRRKQESLVPIALFVVGAVGIALIYLLILQMGQNYDILSAYFSKQFQNRFAKLQYLKTPWFRDFWWTLLKDSYYLLPLSLITLGLAFKNKKIFKYQYPAILLLSFFALYAPNGRTAFQYQLMVLPWVAWMVAPILAKVIKRPSDEQLVRGLQVLFVITIVVIQYFPTKTHAKGPPPEVDAIIRMKKEFGIQHWAVDSGLRFDDPKYDELPKELKPKLYEFSASMPYAWYADIDFDFYLNAMTELRPDPKRGLLFLSDAKDFNFKGWCVYEKFAHSAIYRACSAKPIHP